MCGWIIATWKRPHPETAPTASKAAGLYMIGTLAKHAAEAAGFDDALMLDWRGHVAEGTGANVFFVIDGELHTPDAGLLPRRHHPAHRHVARPPSSDEGGASASIMPDEMPSASEVFLAGTAAEVTPVRQIGPHVVHAGPRHRDAAA